MIDLDAAEQLNGNLPVGETDWYYRNLVPKELQANLMSRY